MAGQREATVLTAGVRAVLLSPQWQQILHTCDPLLLDAMDSQINPLPAIANLEGADDDRLFRKLAYLVLLLDYNVRLASEVDSTYRNARGATWHRDHLVLIRRPLPPLQRAKTLAHELGHVSLRAMPLRNHRSTQAAAHRWACRQGVSDWLAMPSRRRSELLAETFAWLLMRRLGVDTSQFSFAHIAKYGDVRCGAALYPAGAIATAVAEVTGRVEWAIANLPPAVTGLQVKAAV